MQPKLPHLEQGHQGNHALVDVQLAECDEGAEEPGVGEVEVGPKTAANHSVEAKVAHSVHRQSADLLSQVWIGS